ncbi:hypothetical protein EPO05_04910 [Patescibacteria group bacterium]|nr:MAG: hypothetical protein EPO05_04910 [Patescibacteria group bacterium]
MGRKTIISILIVFVGLPLSGYVAYRALREAKRTHQIQAEVQGMREEAERVRKNNEELRDKIAYFETPEYQEKTAKDKLNLQREGEQVAIIKLSPSLREENQPTSAVAGVQVDSRPNYQKWWDYFFKY